MLILPTTVERSPAFMVSFSAWTFTGAASRAYGDGWPIMVIYLANAVGFFINAAWFGPKIRQLRVVTGMEAVRQRFGRASEQTFTWITLPLQMLTAGIWLYGLGVFGLYALLGALGMPTFYDKLLCVPLLNLAVPSIDRAVRAIGDKPLLHTLGLDPPLGRANLAHMAVWVLIFGVMTMTGAADGMHKGDSLPFWEQACAADKPQACARLLRIEASYCGDNAGWACNELGRHYTEGRLVPGDPERAFAYFARACEGRFQAGCVNLLDASTPARAHPRAFDLRLLLREGGPNLMEMPEPDLYARACKHGWDFACNR